MDDPAPRAPLFSHLPGFSSQAGWSIPRILGAQPSVLDPRTFLAFLRVHCSRAGGSDWVTAPTGKGGGSVTTGAQIPLQEKGRGVFWEVTSMFHLWHPKKRLRVPFGSPLPLLKHRKASTPRKLRKFTLKIFLWRFSPFPFPPLPAHI